MALGVFSVTRARLELDWSSCAATLKINLSRDQEGCDGFGYTDEKFSMRRIHWREAQSSIFIFRGIFSTITSQIMIMTLGSPHSTAVLAARGGSYPTLGDVLARGQLSRVQQMFSQ